jgi:hypothetical protein
LNVQNGLTLSNSTITLGGASGGGTLAFSGAQTLGGTGAIVLAGSSAITPSGGSLTVSPGVTIRTGAQGGLVGSTGVALMNRGTMSAQTAGRTLTLNGALTNQGTFEARAGSLVLAPTATLSNLSSGVLTGGSYSAYANASMIFPGTSITENAATILLDGQGSVFAATTGLKVNSGSFTISSGRDFTAAGGLSNFHKLRVGAGSDLTVSGTYSSDPGSDITFDIGGTGIEAFGQLTATTATLAGSLSITTSSGYWALPGDSFALVSATTRSGTFSVLNLPSLHDGLSLEINYTPTSVILTVVPEPTATIVLPITILIGARRRRRVTTKPSRQSQRPSRAL